MRKLWAVLIAIVMSLAIAPTASANTPGVTVTRTYAVGTDTVTVTWYENGVFTLARSIAITGPSEVRVDRYESVWCTSIQRGPGGFPPVAWTPPLGVRTQCLPYVNVNGVHLLPPSQSIYVP